MEFVIVVAGDVRNWGSDRSWFRGTELGRASKMSFAFRMILTTTRDRLMSCELRGAV
jgi:hypothetical protein